MSQPNQAVPTGVSSYPGLAAYAGKSQADWEAEIFGATEGHFLGAEKGFSGMLGDIPIIGDLIEILTGVEDGDKNDFGTWFNTYLGGNRGIPDASVPGVGQIIDAIVVGLFGWIGSLFSHADAAQALADEAASVAALSAAVAALQNTAANQANSGVSAFVDFSTRANAASLGADFTQTYSGAGTGVWGITDGRAAWQPVNNAARACAAVYNVSQTSTDYQMVGAAFATAPEWFGSTNNSGHNILAARSNTAGTSLVYADLTKYTVELGCYVGGVQTVFATLTSGFSFKANGIYWLRAGTIGGARIFQVLEGNTPIITHTEVGTTSQLGASYRSTEMGVYAFATGGGTANPGRVSAFAFADNQPATVLGVGAHIYRAGTGTVNVTSGTNLLPTSFFDTTAENTTDITIDLTNGKFTVSVDGWYLIEVRSMVTPNLPDRMHAVIYKNGVAEKWVGPSCQRGVTSLGGGLAPESLGGVTKLYLIAGDYIQFGYNAEASVSGTLTGEATGEKTYFGIALANRSQT